jgi:hypothetical protein
MLIGKINRGSRERLMITVEKVKGTKVIDCRVYSILQDGELSATASGVSFPPEQVDNVIDLLKEAKKKAAEQV